MALEFKAAAIDPVLVELLATASLIVRSPEVATLESAIRRELGIF